MKKILLLLLVVSNFVFAQDSDSFKSVVLDNSKKIEALASETNTEVEKTKVIDDNVTKDLIKNLKPFKSIIITSAMDVELISSENPKIEVVGNDVSNLTLTNNDNQLKLTTSLGKKFKSDLKVKIYYTEGLRFIKLANQVVIHSNDTINEQFLEFEAINNVNAILSVKTKDFVANLKLGSNITLEGSTEIQKINASGKCFYDAFNFKSKKSFVKSKASNIAIFVEEFLDVNAKLKSEVTYMGDPYSVNEKTFISKVIHKKK